MVINLLQFQLLGEEIHAKLKRHSFDEKALPAVAAEALSIIELENDFRLDELAEFVIATKIAQRVDEFSNLPLTVYRCEEFFIQILVWMDATTAIHQHAFSGAFRVLVGSSLHSVYEFNERERINSQFLLGDVRLKMAEILRTGDVRPIHPGSTDFVHALFHLDRPSVTVVVRNYYEPWAAPQYTLELPDIAFNEDGLSCDQRVKLFCRLLAAAGDLNQEEAVDLLISKGTILDFPRLFIVLRQNYHLLSAELDWNNFINTALDVHGQLAGHLTPWVRSKKRETSLVLARKEVKDSELRFFLALLLNLPSRTWIYRLIREKFPESSAEDLCCQWLKRLREQERLSSAFIELAKKANLGSDLFRARLNAAVPFERSDPRSEAFLRAAVTRVSQQDFKAYLEEAIGDGIESTRALDAYARLRQVTELDPLFID